MYLGNFAFYKGRFVLLVDYQDTIIGTIWTVMDLDTKAISHVNEQDLTAHTYKPRNMKPASDMTEKQKDGITCIEQQLNLSFNGQTLADVSTFLGLFLEKAREQAYQRRLEKEYNRYWR